MSFAALGFVLLLAVHVVVSTALSVLVALALPWAEARPGAPARRAALLLGLGLLPALAGLVVAVGLALPAWLGDEPRETGETAGPVLVALAAAGPALVLGRAGAALLGLCRTSRLVRRWQAAGRPLAGLPSPRRASRTSSRWRPSSACGGAAFSWPIGCCAPCRRRNSTVSSPTRPHTTPRATT